MTPDPGGDDRARLKQLAMDYGVAMRLVGAQSVLIERGETVERVVDAAPTWEALVAAIDGAEGLKR